jgi:hypothetical protein
MSRLWEFLSADPAAPGLQDALSAELSQNRDAQWQQQKAGEIAGALQKGKQGSWRDMFTAQDRQIFLDVASKTLAAWGYPEHE